MTQYRFKAPGGFKLKAVGTQIITHPIFLPLRATLLGVPLLTELRLRFDPDLLRSSSESTAEVLGLAGELAACS